MKKFILFVIALTMLLSMLAPMLAKADPADHDYGQGIYDLFNEFWMSRQDNPPDSSKGSIFDRVVFLKTHGCVTGHFQVLPNLPPEFSKGLFATPVSKEVWVRISSDTPPATPDQVGKTVGIAIKVLGVEGDHALSNEDEPGQTSQDFLLENYPVFFADKSIDFYNITNGVANSKADRIIKKMERQIGNVLNQVYWSALPYALGDRHVKYKLTPCSKDNNDSLASSPANYLKQRLEQGVAAKGFCFNLTVQMRDESKNRLVGKEDDNNDEPLDMATIEWKEARLKQVVVAQVTADPHDITRNSETCKNWSFNPWHSLKIHQPEGSISKARRFVYTRMAKERRDRTHAPLSEPLPK